MRRTLAALACGVALGAQAAGERAQWYLQVDTDVVFATDRWYTSGVRIARVKAEDAGATEWGLIQEIYTPESRYYEFGRTDRAPSARLLASFARHDNAERHLQTIELQAGVRGPAALGQRTTRLVHRVIAADEVDWSRQEKNRVDFSAIFSRTELRGPLSLYYGAVLGNQITFVHTGVEFHAGTARTREIHSPMLRFAATPPLARAPDGGGWGAFIGASGRGVIRNDLVARSYGVGEPDLFHRRAVARFAAGLTWANPRATVSFALAQDTREFDSQRTPHKFGSLTASIDF